MLDAQGTEVVGEPVVTDSASNGPAPSEGGVELKILLRAVNAHDQHSQWNARVAVPITTNPRLLPEDLVGGSPGSPGHAAPAHHREQTDKPEGGLKPPPRSKPAVGWDASHGKKVMRRLATAPPRWRPAGAGMALVMGGTRESGVRSR